MFQERPWLFTVLFCTLTLDVVLDLRTGKASRWIWLLPVCYALWANLHIQFVNGLMILGTACVAPLLDRLLGWGDRSGGAADVAGSHGWWTLVALTGLCIVATLLNPYHVQVWALVFELARQTAPYDLIIELQALQFRAPWEWAVLALTGLAAFALGRRSRLSAFEVLLLASTAFLSFRCRRDAWLVVLAAVAILATPRATVADRGDTFVIGPLRGLLVATGAAVAVALAVWNGRLAEDSLEEIVASRFPDAAARVIQTKGYPGPLYNNFDWGGYLIWRLPELPVAIDGRANLHGDERMRRSALVWNGERGWDDDPDLRAARLVLSPPTTALASLLRRDAHFEIAYEDEVAVVFRRTKAAASL
jgi:hypothetical protein